MNEQELLAELAKICPADTNPHEAKREPCRFTERKYFEQATYHADGTLKTPRREVLALTCLCCSRVVTVPRDLDTPEIDPNHQEAVEK